MSSTAATVSAPIHVGGFTRFIDTVKAFFVKAEPVEQEALTVAEDAEPILALTPAGPEYQIAVEAIKVAQQTAATALSVGGAALTNEQKAQIAINAATPALNTILASKGISTNTETHIANWIQNIFNIFAGPVASIVKSVDSPAK